MHEAAVNGVSILFILNEYLIYYFNFWIYLYILIMII